MAVLFSVLWGCSSSGGGGGTGGSDADLDRFPISPVLDVGEQTKMSLLESEGRTLQRVPVPSVELYAATAPGRPRALLGELVLPEEGSPVYSNGLRASFVPEEADQVLWFALGPKKEGTAAVVWQIADRPFDGDGAEWQTPTGLLASGVLGAAAEEFSIDFSQIVGDSSRVGRTVGLLPVSGRDMRLRPRQTIVHARAVAVDEDRRTGKGAGDPVR